MHARNAGLQRLRSTTRKVGIVTTVLTGIFAGLAAASNSGHHRRVLAQLRPPGRSPASTSANRIPPPPSLPPLASGAPQGSQSPASPSQPPVQAQEPPVVVSGGS
jgi:hypothetical protein